MKLSSFVLTILFIGFLFASWNLLIGDMETQYVNSTIIDTDPVNETYTGSYDVSEEINSSFSNINTALRKIEEEGGWASFLSGGVAISAAFLKLPAIVLLSTATALGNFMTLGKLAGIPQTLIGILTIMITIFIIFKLLEGLRRYEV